jgi:hypothetical protein
MNLMSAVLVPGRSVVDRPSGGRVVVVVVVVVVTAVVVVVDADGLVIHTLRLPWR